MEFFIYLAICAGLGFAGMHMAESRGRSKGGGFGIGFILGLLGLAIIALMGPKHGTCSKEGEDE